MYIVGIHHPHMISVGSGGEDLPINAHHVNHKKIKMPVANMPQNTQRLLQAYLLFTAHMEFVVDSR